MIDFHAHVLPGMDDGAETTDTSLILLHSSGSQGVKTVFATPHFYAAEISPSEFLRQRSLSYKRLLEAASRYPDTVFPRLELGAEILYFPGMSCAEELAGLALGGTGCIMIEPPMIPWTDSILDEIFETGRNLHLVPVIAHVDRYMRMLKLPNLIDRVIDRHMLVQVNASYFLRPEFADIAIEDLRGGKIHMIGSDCHNASGRPQNMGLALQMIQRGGAEDALNRLDSIWKRRITT